MSTLTLSNKSSSNTEQTMSFSSEIEVFYHRTRPYPDDIKEKETLCAYIKDCVRYLQNASIKESNQTKKKKKFSQTKQKFLENMKQRKTYNAPWKVFTFGSASWGTHIGNDSDIDMAISLNFRNTRADKTFILHRLSQIISENDNDGLLRVQILCHAKYPIIRIHHIYFKSIKVDISIADRYCFKRNQLMIEYMNYYQQKFKIPIKKLIVFIKYWSKQRGINCAYYGYLNSFGFTLLVIQFVQYYLKQLRYPNRLYDNSLETLVEKFFEFYAFKYDASKHSICIGSNMDEFGKKNDLNCMMEIIDPINRENNVAKNIAVCQFNRMYSEFLRAVNIISLNKESLFQLLTQNKFGNNDNDNGNDNDQTTSSDSASLMDETVSPDPVSDSTL